MSEIPNTKKTLVLGATTNPGRYAYLAAQLLMENGKDVVLVGIKNGEVNGVPIQREFPTEPMDTITLYVGPRHQKEYYDLILENHPRRVIFNPGTENPELIELLQKNGIETEVACTLVLLRTGQY
ncbi:MAG: CoA-binding protein [Bacteroidota bacterium]|nr:CoA-binding protein [Bacteroidota bacterium]